MAREYLARSGITLDEVRLALSRQDFALAIRRAQETVELSLKAAIRFLGVEYPKEHDVSEVLRELPELRQLPEWFSSQMADMARISSDLARKRGPAFYGEENELRPPSALFRREDAEMSLRDAEMVHKTCRRLIEEGSRKR